MPPKLIAVTSPVDGHMTPEESIVYMARVSSPNQRTEDADKLLTYLVKHGHWSPFDMVDMTVEIETSRAIMAQVLRHSSFRFQEFSQRYAEAKNLDFSDLEIRLKHEAGNRQGSGESSSLLSEHAIFEAGKAAAEYEWLLDCGVAPESARMVLPLCTPTRAYMKGSVRSWMTYFWQRCNPHAQKEHRELAELIFDIFCLQFPVIGGLVKKYKPQIIDR